MGISIVQVSQVTPPPGCRYEQTLPLSYHDIVRLPYHLLNFPFFYKFPCSRSHFLNTVVPSLKTSLSLSLKHFLPLAGNIVFPLAASPHAAPFSRYTVGDSVPFTVAISDADFDHMTANHPRDSDQFHGFSPPALPNHSSDDFIAFSPLAVQVTLLPDQGICISQTLNHAISDGGTVLAFTQAWASINKHNCDDAHLGEKFASSYDRIGTVADKDLATRAWNYAAKYSPTTSLTISLPTNKVRATFFMSYNHIQKLKTIALNKKPCMARMASSTVLLSAYIWTCLAKSVEIAGEEDVFDNEAEYLTCTADIRGRMNPPLPLNYFGNCTVLVLAETTHGRLKGKDGFVSAAEAIGEAILENKKENVVDDLDIRVKVKSGKKRVVTIAGSPRFELYGLDCGFGKAYKFEYPTNDCDGSVFICKPKGGGGIEIIMSMSKAKMDAFSALFHQGLKEEGEIAEIVS